MWADHPQFVELTRYDNRAYIFLGTVTLAALRAPHERAPDAVSPPHVRCTAMKRIFVVVVAAVPAFLDPGCLADRRDACSPVRGRAEIAPVGDYFRRVKIQD